MPHLTMSLICIALDLLSLISCFLLRRVVDALSFIVHKDKAYSWSATIKRHHSSKKPSEVPFKVLLSTKSFLALLFMHVERSFINATGGDISRKRKRSKAKRGK